MAPLSRAGRPDTKEMRIAGAVQLRMGHAQGVKCEQDPR